MAVELMRGTEEDDGNIASDKEEDEDIIEDCGIEDARTGIDCEY